MTALSPRRTFSGTALKTIACITMLVDHIGASCIEAGILTPGLDAGTLSQDTLSAYPLYRLDMVLRVTDPALLAQTGGIVQGMSGSPIIQDGKLIGAVTHVFVSDPTQGYGLYVDWMLSQMQGTSADQ
mgnify:CR=1 FL=1